MRAVRTAAAAAVALLALGRAAPSPAPRYAEGQVWEYRTRPGDEGSLLKIQKIEDLLKIASPLARPDASANSPPLHFLPRPGPC